ncbi:MAG: hypothetical protein ABDH23_04130 [Endomicrobiia bacterium]
MDEPIVKLHTPNDPYDVEPTTVSLVAGQYVFTNMLNIVRAGTHTIIVEDIDGIPPLYISTTSKSFYVSPRFASQLQVLVPNQQNVAGNWVGSPNAQPPYGKNTAVTQTQTAGVAFTVTVNACDTYWNITTTGTTIWVYVMKSATEVDPYAVVIPTYAYLVNTATFSVTVKTAKPRRIKVTDGELGLLDQLGEVFNVNANVPSKIFVILPGETEEPGSSTGKYGTSSWQEAGYAFQPKIQLVDDYFNPTAAPQDITVRLTTEDPYDSYTYGEYIDCTIPTNNTDATLPEHPKLITATTTGWKLTADDISPNIYETYITEGVKVKPRRDETGAERKLLVTLPGEVAVWGKPPYNTTTGGKSGMPQPVTAGLTFSVTVYACDYYWNCIDDNLFGISPPEGNPVVKVETSDPYDIEPPSEQLIDGRKVFNITLVKAGTFTVRASDIDGIGIYYQPYTSLVSTCQAAAAVKLLAVLPGETYMPGSANGKTGTPQIFTAGVPFNITVYGCDQYWNLQPNAVALVRVTDSDVYNSTPALTSLINGQAVIQHTFVTAATHYVTVEDVDADPLASYTVPVVTVTANVPKKLLAVLPGEMYKPGKYNIAPYGKEGTPVTQTAGVPFSVTVYATDDYYNRTSTFVACWLTTTDPYDVELSTLTLIAGATTFRVTFVSATDPLNWNNTGWSISVYSAGSMQTYTSAGIPVQPNLSTTNDRIQVLLPGETARAGKPPYTDSTGGKEGTVSSALAGENVLARVYITDYYWNRRTDSVSNINLDCAGFQDYTGDGKTPKFVTLTQGTSNYYLVFYTTGSWSINATHPDYLSYNSSVININPAATNKLLVVLQGEDISPLAPLGRSGVPQDATAGALYNVKIYACDAYYNWQSVEELSSTVRLTTSDQFDVEPTNLVLQQGTTVFTIIPVTAGTQTVTVYDLTPPLMDSNISSVFTVLPNNPARLLVLLPGETIVSGSPTGKQGTPIVQTAGVSFGCTVYATDLYYNRVNDTSWIRIDTSDKWDIHPSTQQLVNGATIFFVTLVTAGQQYLYAVDTDAPYLYTSTSSVVTVQPKTDVLSELKLHVIVPGETYEPGKWENGVNPAPYGKQGIPSDQIAGNNFTIDVFLVDKFYNRIYSGVPMPWVQPVKVGEFDPYAVYPSSKQLIAGATNFVIQFRTSGWAVTPSSWTITIRDVDGVEPAYPDAVSPKITVLPNVAKRMQMILPGETWIPGSPEGKSGTPEAWVVDSTRTIIVQVCDDYWNVTNTNITATLTTEDPYDTPDPHSLGITAGRIFVDRNLVTATTEGWRLTVSASGMIEYVSPKVIVNPGPPVKLLALVPNETYNPGSPTGKSGTVVPQQAGVPFTLTVFITDSRWNLVTSTSALLSVTTEDPYDIHPATKSTTNGFATFEIEFRRGVGESYKIIVSTAAGNELTRYITPPIQSNYGSATKLQILVPGETAVPGRWYTSGKDGTPTPWYAGDLYPVVVNVVDKYWNPVPVVNTTVRLSATDPYYEPPLDAATNMGTVTIYTSLATATTEGWKITASTAPTAANPYLQPDTSANIKVLPGKPIKLLVLAPGEQPLPGSPTGRQGVPQVQVAGSSFTIRVHATDSRWNIAESSRVVKIITDDSYDSEPSTETLITTDEYLSIATFTLVLITANRGSLDPANRNTLITAQDVTEGVPPYEKLANGQTTVPVTPQPAQYLMLLVPGQTHNPGKPPYFPQVGGKDGTPQNLTAGVTYWVTVLACDLYWNINPADNPYVKVWTSDPYDLDPTPLGLENGMKSFPINLRRATLYQGLQESLTIYAIHNADPQQYAATFVGGIQVTPEANAVQLLILVPNEKHEPGSPSGKTGIVMQQTAGVSFDVVVNCVDRFNNIVPTAQPGVTLTSSDPNDGVGSETGLGWDPAYQPLLNGTTIYKVTLVTASTWHWLTAEDTDGNPPYYGRRDSSLIWVNPGPPVKLQCLLPGEVSKPNTTKGKEGTPHTQVAGQPFNVAVRITDILWNLVPTAGANVKLITPYDEYDTEPVQSTVNGEAIISKVIYTASQERIDTNPPYWEPFKYHIIIATDTGGLYWTNISSTFTVTSSSFTKLHVILPGQKYIPGKPPYDGTSGKEGEPIVQTAGVPVSGGTIIRAGTTIYFNVAVFAVDNYYNLVYSGQLVSILTQDPYDTHPPAQALNLGYTNFANVAMVTSSSWTITAQASGVSPGVSSAVFIKPNVPTRLAIYAPGEVPTPGYTVGRGRIGTPYPQTAGTYFDLTVRACDAYYNLTNASPTVTVLVDDWDIDYEVYRISRTKELINGTTTFTVRFAAAKVTVATATASGYLSDYTGGISINPDTPFRLLILPPGVTAQPGKPPYVSSETVTMGGISGTPSAQTAGQPFNITIRAVDRWWNKTSAQPIVTLESNDPWDYPDQKQVQLINGEYVLSWTLVSRNDTGWYIRSVNSILPTLVNYRTSNIKVNPNTATSLKIYLPGEQPEWGETSSHPSATLPYGISGVPAGWTAGIPRSILVHAVDNYNNRQDNDVSAIKVTPTDPFVSAQLYGLEAGSKTFTFSLVTAGTHTFLAEDQDAPLLNSYRSSVFTVNVSTWGKQLHITLPGESYLPGKPPYDVDEQNRIGGTGGKTGTPQIQIAGVPFTVTVRAVDSFYNLLTDEVSLVKLTPSISQYASDIGQPYPGWVVEPSENSLVGGISTFTVTLLTAHSTWTILAEDIDASPTLAKGYARVYVKPNNPQKLQVIVPDEIESPGSSLGKTGTIKTQTAGVGFTIRVNLCDAYWNRVKEGPMPLVSVWTSDPYDTHPTALTLVNGQRLFSLTLVTASSVTITASGGGYTMGISSEVPVIPNVPAKLLVVVPPQQQINGKNIPPEGRSSISVSSQTAGVPFQVTIYAVDNWYNFVSTVSQTITVTTSDDYDTDPGNISMIGGVAVCNVDFRTAKPQTITAIDNDPNTPSLQSHVSSLIPVRPNVPKKLHVCVPGEVYDPGRPPYVPGSTNGGKQGIPSNQTAGVSFNVTVRITDDYWNLTSILPAGATVQLNTNDLYSPSNNLQFVVYSSAVIPVTLVSASSATADKVVYVEDIDGVEPTLSVGRSQNIFVGPGTPTKLLLVLPGQTLVGGHPRGKVGQPQLLVAGQQFSVTTAITDAYFNPVPGVSVTLQADSPLDNYDTEPPRRDVDVVTGKQYFDFTLVTASTHYLRVRDVDGVPPLYQEYPANPLDLAVTTFTVKPANAVKLQLILPGETPVPGKYNISPYGKIGSPLSMTAGELWYATVRLVDSYYNLVTDVSIQPQVAIRTADPFDIEPSTEPLSSGQGLFPIVLRTAATWHYLVVEDVDGLEPLYQSDISPTFTVNPSTPTRLLVLVPDETFIQGSPYGKTGGIQDYVAGQSFVATVYLVDNYNNRVRTGWPMPTVAINTWDPKDSEPAAKTLIDGANNFTLVPLHATSSWTLTAVDIDGQPPHYQSGISSFIRIWPAVVHHMHIVEYPSTVVAGTGFSAKVQLRDQYDNLVSTGINWTTYALGGYRVKFDGEYFPSPQTPELPSEYDWTLADRGEKLFSGIVLKKAGQRWIKTYQTNPLNTLISSERPCDPNPNIQGEEGEHGPLYTYIFVQPGPPASFFVVETTATAGTEFYPYEIKVPAGTRSDWGKLQIVAYLSDAYANIVPSSGVPVNIEVIDVVGSTGVVSYTSPASDSQPPEPVVYAVTDSSGAVGLNPPLYYYCSHKLGDSAKVKFSTGGIVGVTRKITTIGGTPYRLVALNPPLELVAGNETPYIVIQRRDEFDNPTYQGDTWAQLVTNSLAKQQQPQRQWDFRSSPGAENTLGPDYVIWFYNSIKSTSVAIIYYDEMSSIPENEDGRPQTGKWTIQIQAFGNEPARWASFDLLVKPDEITKAAFDNPQRKLTAGSPKEYTSIGPGPNSLELEVELQDRWNNPVRTTYPVVVLLSSIRETSRFNDSYSFSLSSKTTGGPAYGTPPVFEISITSFVIETNEYYKKFYYLDTNASENYSVVGNTYPIVIATPLGKKGDGTPWASAQQSVLIMPDRIRRLGIYGKYSIPPDPDYIPTLTAGVTSQVMMLATEDFYGNIAPVLEADVSGDNPRRIKIVSSSTGSVKFALPSISSWTVDEAIAYFRVGDRTTSFYLIDTLATVRYGVYDTTHTLFADTIVNPGLWTQGRRAYRVLPNLPHYPAIVTPPRRLIAGTTIQFDGTGTDISTITVSAKGGKMVIKKHGEPLFTGITVEIRDKFGNVTVSTENIILSVEVIDSPQAYGSVDPTQDLDGAGWTLMTGGGNLLPVLIPAGSDSGTFYYFDTIVGSHTMKISGRTSSGRTLIPMYQTHYITPAPIEYFTIHHPFTIANPLRVHEPGLLTVKARDRYGNVAAGDYINGQWYEGTIVFTHSGNPEKVILKDAISLTTYYTFVKTDAGVYNRLQVIDQIQETLKVFVTDYATINLPDEDPDKIYGYTGDILREVPVHSDDDVVTCGIVVEPADLAPVAYGDADNSESTCDDSYTKKQELLEGTIYQGKTALFQGDGNTYEKPAPVPMLRLNLRVLPQQVAESATWTQLRVDKKGTALAQDVWIGLYYDANGDGKFQGEAVLGGTSPDPLVKVGVYDPVSNAWNFTGMSEFISNVSKNYFLCVRISTVAQHGTYLGLEINNHNYLTTVGVARVAANNFRIFTDTSAIKREEAKVYCLVEDIAASVETRRSTFVYQGQPNAGMLRIKIRTKEYTAYLNGFKITRTGSGTDADIKGVALFIDDNGTGDPKQGDGLFQPALDTRVSDWIAFSTRTAVVYLKQVAEITPSTVTYFVSYKVSDSAYIGKTHGAAIVDSADIRLAEGVVLPIPGYYSSLVTVLATSDEMTLIDYNKNSPNNFSVPGAATQGDKDVVVARLTLQTMQRTAIWTGLKLDRYNPNKVNQPEDIENIKVWFDTNNNGLFDKSSDTLVSPADKKYTFPVTKIAVDVSTTSDVIYVEDVSKLVLSPIIDFSPFPETPGRVVLSDGSDNLEVVYFSGVDRQLNALTGCLRGREGTQPRFHPKGSKVSGQAILWILGNFYELGPYRVGQEIVSEYPKDYFITVDINYLAKVHEASQLGISIRSTDYFKVVEPDYVSNRFGIIGPKPQGKSESGIGSIMEYPDRVTFKLINISTEVVAYLQQGKTNVPIASLIAYTDESEAWWQQINIHGTGSATDNNLLTDEIKYIKIWYDLNNNGSLNPDIDVCIATATFGNVGKPLMSQVVFPVAPKIITTPRAQLEKISQRYFITVDIEENAHPEQTFGIALTTWTDITVSLPNYLDKSSSTIPFETILRTIIPSPRMVTVDAQPLWLNKEGEIIKETIYLNSNIDNTDTFIPLNISAINYKLKEDGYAILNNEIIKYSSVSQEGLSDVQRGVEGSYAVSHASGSLVGFEVVQGQKNVPLLKLVMYCSGFQVQLPSIKFTRTQPSPLNGDDADISYIKVWKDNGDGELNRDPNTGFISPDVEVFLGQAKFGVPPDPASAATVMLNDPLYNRGYALITTTPTIFWVTADISASAKFTHPQISNLNEVFGVAIPLPTNINLAPKEAGHWVSTATSLGNPAFPIVSPVSVIVPTLDTLIVEAEGILPPGVYQNQKNVGVLRLNFKSNKNSVTVKRIKLDMLGTAVDGDIALVKIWKDLNNNGIFDLEDTTRTATGEYPGLLSFGTDRFSDKTVNIELKTPLVIDDSPLGTNIFISFDIAEFARLFAKFSASVEDETYITVEVPDDVSFVVKPIRTAETTIYEAPSEVILRVYDVAKDIANLGGTYQAEKNVPVLRIKMRTDVAQAIWERIRLEKTGSSADPALPYGKNADVGYIKIYKDANFNEQLDSADTLISEIYSELVVEISSDTRPPFFMVIKSSTTPLGSFPENHPQLWVKVNDEIFEYTKIATVAVNGIEYPALYITKRAHLGSYASYHSSGSIVRKCDMYYLNDDLNRQKEITLVQPQLISPTPQTYFIAYDIGENASAGNAVGVKLVGKEAITIKYPNEASSQLEIEQDIQGISIKQDIYPFETSLVRINPVTLKVSAESVAPVQVPQRTQNVPFIMLTIQTDRNYVKIKKIYVTQTGTVQTPGAIGGYGQGDLSGMSVWLDNGDGFFSPALDLFITSVTHPTVDFSAGAARISLPKDGLYVSTSPVRIFIAGNIGKTDLAGTSTKDHYVGVEITSFKSLETIPSTIESHITNRFPLRSSLVLILDEYAPRVMPKWVVLAQKQVYANPFGDGYPAVDVDGDTMPDRVTQAGEVFVDLDEDGTNDLEDLDGDGRKNDIDLVGDGKLSIDMTGDGVLDVDFNCDGKPDSVVPDVNGDGIPEIDLSRDGIIDWGYTPERWTNRTTQLYAQWKHTPEVLDYRVGAGNVANVNNLTEAFAPGGWLSTRRAPKFTITNLSLQAAKVTRLTKSVSRLDTPPFDLFVESTDGFPAEKSDIYVGGEIMYYETKSQNSFRITQRAKYDTPAQDHPAYTKVTNQGTFYRVHGIGQGNTAGPVISLILYRVDVTPPKAPSKPVSDYDRSGRDITEGVYTIEWSPASDEESGIMGYEIQERVDTNPVWRTIRFVAGSRTSFVVGNSDTPDNKPREKGHFYYYRVRAKNYAGSYSNWSEISNGVSTGLPEEVISQVSNYPNPVDIRLGGEEGRTYIVYLLNQDAEVTLTIYDLLGFKVREWTFQPGQEGGKKGANRVPEGGWDGTNQAGQKVSKGGYIAQIKVKSTKGVITAIRKIGVIR